MKTMEIKATKNGTDYVSMNFLQDGKRIGGFNSAIKTVKSLADAGFLGKLGLEAVTDYISTVTPEQIIADMKARDEKKGKNKYSI